IEDLGLEKAGVKQDDKGRIIADEYQNTNVENIYSLGDVVGKLELTPVAIAAGRRLGDRLFGGEQFRTSKLDYTNVPSIVVSHFRPPREGKSNYKQFAHPECGAVGLT